MRCSKAAAYAAVCVMLGHPGPVAAQQCPDSILGSWEGVVTATSLPGHPSFVSLVTFTPNGGVTETRRSYVPQSGSGPVLQTAGAGSWAQSSRNTFQFAYKFLLEGAPNNPTLAGQALGTDNIRWDAHFDPRAQTLTGPWRSVVIDETGHVVATFHGDLVAKRLKLPAF